MTSNVKLPRVRKEIHGANYKTSCFKCLKLAYFRKVPADHHAGNSSIAMNPVRLEIHLKGQEFLPYAYFPPLLLVQE